MVLTAEDVMDFEVDELAAERTRAELVNYAMRQSIDTFDMSRRDIVVALKLVAFRDLGWSLYGENAVEMSSEELAAAVGMDMTIPDVDYDEALLTFEPPLEGVACADHTAIELLTRLQELGMTARANEDAASICARIERVTPRALTPGRVGLVRAVGAAADQEETLERAALRRAVLAKPRLELIRRELECRNLTRRDLQYYANFLGVEFDWRDATSDGMCRAVASKLFALASHEYRSCMGVATSARDPFSGRLSTRTSIGDLRAQATRAGITDQASMTRAELCRALGDRRAVPSTIIARARQLGIQRVRGKSTTQLLRELNAIENRYTAADDEGPDDRALQTTMTYRTLSDAPLIRALRISFAHDRWARMFVDALYKRGMRYDTDDAALLPNARAVLAELAASGLVEEPYARRIVARIDAYAATRPTVRQPTTMLTDEYVAPRPIAFGRRFLPISATIASGIHAPTARSQALMDQFGYYPVGEGMGDFSDDE
jgi:hypothetical protein